MIRPRRADASGKRQIAKLRSGTCFTPHFGYFQSILKSEPFLFRMLSMRHRTLLGLFAILGLTIAFTGCGDGGKKKSADKTGGDTPPKPKVAFVSNNAYQFWTFAQRGAEKAAAEDGVELEFRKPQNGTVQVQREIIEDLINRGFTGVAVSPNEPANTIAFYKNTVAKKMSLVMTDNDLPDPAARKCYIGTHNYRAGRDAGALVKQALPKGGKIAIFVGKADSPNAVERRQGVLDVLAGKDLKNLGEVTSFAATDLDLGNGYALLSTQIDESNEAKCQAKAEDLLINHPDVDCLVGLWEYNPPALLRAVGKKARPLIVAFDENDQTLNGIKSGKVVGTIVQNPYEFGYQSIKVLASLAKGKDDVLKTWPGIEKDNSIFVPTRIITKDNVEAFEAEVKKILGN
jgi:ribose transport system substrate-binding protein